MSVSVVRLASDPVVVSIQIRSIAGIAAMKRRNARRAGLRAVSVPRPSHLPLPIEQPLSLGNLLKECAANCGAIVIGDSEKSDDDPDTRRAGEQRRCFPARSETRDCLAPLTFGAVPPAFADRHGPELAAKAHRRWL